MKIGTSWDELGQVGTSWEQLGQVGTNWEPKKLQKFDIKKKPLEKEERKKKNIGYRVASNERRLIILNIVYFQQFYINVWTFIRVFLNLKKPISNYFTSHALLICLLECVFNLKFVPNVFSQIVHLNLFSS